MRKGLRRLRSSAQNAREIIEFGRLGDPWGSPYEIVHASHHHRLRRYSSVHSEPVPAGRDGELSPKPLPGPVLLIPPLMVTSEVYDVAPEISAVSALTNAGIDVWLVDFGAPEREEGGLTRTLDDHVLAIDDSIDRILAATGADVHLLGYSQGGMFAYQAAAYRRGEGIASLVTFGSPVDIHRNLPALDAELVARMIGVARRAIAQPLAQLEGLPGFLTSTGFKVLSLRKELEQISDFLAKLHDREALVARESRRRFLGGEGFVAWPGPALRTFVDEFIVANRMSAGGFVIAGRTATLASIERPILYFVGERDEIARAASVRGIVNAAPAAETFEMTVPAGHFGLVVGSAAMAKTWPTVIEWIRWRAGGGSRPSLLPGPKLRPSEGGTDEVEELEVEVEFEPIVDVVGEVVGSVVGSIVDLIEDGGRELGEALDDFRYQLPRLRTLEALEADTRISLGLELADRAARHPDRTFFLWRGRAFSYAEADRRIDAVVRGLIDRGLRAGQRVGVLMDGRPSYLVVVSALNRMGAVAVLFKPLARDHDDGALEMLREAIGGAELEALLSDPQNARDAVACWQARGQVLVLGGAAGGRRERALPAGTFDMETIDPARVALPDWYVPNPGRARDLAMAIVTTRPWSPPREAKISNGRWAVSAYGAAATCLLSSRDTVYCVLPLHHAAGMLVAASGALVGRSRLALAEGFDARTFWPQLRQYGATVVFYAGEMCRELVDAPRSPAEGQHALRVLAGSGMRRDLWVKLRERLGPVAIREFYASTEGNLVLANISGKAGALGRPLPGCNELAVVAYDYENDDFVRDAQGQARRCRDGEAGLLIAKVGATHPSFGSEGEAGTDAVASFRRNVFGTRDTWFVTGDLVRRDSEGDFWYVDRTSHLIRGPHGWISAREIEDALYRGAGVRLVVVYGLEPDADAKGREAAGERRPPQIVVATIVVREPERFDLHELDARVAELRPEQRPSVVRLRTKVALTDGFRPLKTPLIAEGLSPDDPHQLRWNPERSAYERR